MDRRLKPLCWRPAPLSEAYDNAFDPDDPALTDDVLHELLEAMTGSDFAAFIRVARRTRAGGAMPALSPRLEQLIMTVGHARANDLTDALYSFTIVGSHDGLLENARNMLPPSGRVLANTGK